MTGANRFPYMAAVLLAFAVLPEVDAQEAALYRINAGGGTYVDASGQVWEPDTGYASSGLTYGISTAIGATADDPLYQAERWGPSWEPEMHYVFPVPPGAYLVRLHFAEIYSGITVDNPRLFDVEIEGGIVLDDYDIFGTVGFATAAVEELAVDVADGALDIVFIHQVENPKLSAIEILEATQPDAPALAVSPGTLDFGTTTLPDAPASIPVTLVNTGTADLDISSIGISGTDAALFNADAVPPYTVTPGAAVAFNVSFLSPGTAGVYEAQLDIASNAPDSPATVPIVCELLAPALAALSVSPDPIDFGLTPLPDAPPPISLTLSNAGSAELTVSSVSLTGADASLFAANASTPYVIAPAGDVSFDVSFLSPGAEGLYQAALEIASDDPGSPTLIAVHAELYEPIPPTINVYPDSLAFGSVVVGTTSAAAGVELKNLGELALEISGIALEGADPLNFAAALDPLPITLAPLETANLSVTFLPDAEQTFAADLRVVSNDPAGDALIALSGTGAAGTQQVLYRVNAGGPDYTDPDGRLWENDGAYHTGGQVWTSATPIAGTELDPIYQSERWGPSWEPELAYAFPVEAGSYLVRLHFAEIYAGITVDNPRVFDVDVEGQLAVDNLDVSALVGFAAAHVEEVSVEVLDASLDITFLHELENPKLSGIEILTTGVPEPIPPEVAPSSLAFGTIQLGETSPVQTLTITNNDTVPYNMHMVERVGDHPDDFDLVSTPAVPIDIAPGDSVTVDVAFAPLTTGLRQAQVKLHFDAHSLHLYVPVSGTGEQPASTLDVLYRFNAGGPPYTDPDGNLWEADAGYYNTGDAFETASPIAGTDKPILYQSERWDSAASPEMAYTFPVPNGTYLVRLRFAEIYDGITAPGQRVFDVTVEGALVLDDYDIYAMTGPLAAVTESIETDVTDGALEIGFAHVTENPKISAIEIARAGQILADTYYLSWGHVPLGDVGETKNIVLTNTGSTTATISSLAFLIDQGAAHDFKATLGGTDYAGDHTDVAYAVNEPIGPGASVTVPVVFTPTEESDNDVTLEFAGDFAPVSVRLLAIGGEYPGHPYLHVVIGVEPFVVDYDQDGFEQVYLEGEFSHTHEVGHVLTAFEWSEYGTPFATTVNTNQTFPTGEHTVSLTIWDDNTPPDTLSNSATFLVVEPDAVPGALALYYDGAASGPAALLDAVPAHPDYVEMLPGVLVEGDGAAVGGSPFTGNVMVQVLGQLHIQTPGSYEFIALGGVDTRLFVDGAPVVAPVSLAAGLHDIEARFAVVSLGELPLSVEYGPEGSPLAPIDNDLVTHDQTAMNPVINAMPSEGLDLGGYPVTIEGLGFFPENQVVVHWGGADYSGPDLTVTPAAVTFVVPPGDGLIYVAVETPNGLSNAKPFTYSASGPVPVDFTLSDVASLPAPTVAAWGQDGRLYVGSISGAITAFTFNDEYLVAETETITTLEAVSNPNILGMTTNPFDPPGPTRIYVAHSLLYANGGTCFEGFSPYSGQISILTGPDFDVVEPLITGLPVSNHDHGINGLQFDNNGDLLIAVGGNTNAGVPDCNIGGIDESPLSAAILKAETSKPDFNGEIIYVETDTGLVNNDQVYGDIVDVAPGVDVSVFAAGFRNTFDLVFSQSGRVYNMDNGPNGGFGPPSTGPDTQGPYDASHGDELNLSELGNYYGHPNRNRGRYDYRQYVYHDNVEPEIAGVFSQALETFPASTNGIIEYNANTFRGAMRGELIAQQWNGATYRVALSENGRTVAAKSNLPVSLWSLDIVQGPGGVILGVDYSNNKLVVAKPVDVAATGLTLYDIRPWRAPADGGRDFVIGGVGFGDVSNTSVTIGGVPCTVGWVTPTQIHGVIPPNPSPTADFLDVAVTVAGETQVLAHAFRYLFPAGEEDTGAAAYAAIDPGGTISDSSTYTADSFVINNVSTRGQNIERVRIDLSAAILPDLVFDPDGLAGDPVAKPFTVDTDSGVGLTGHAMLHERDDGYEVLDIAFNDFGPADTIGFSIDVDPTSIRGASAPGPGDSASVSGLELAGAAITVYFDDGATLRSAPYRIPASNTGSEIMLVATAPQAPEIDALGVSGQQAAVTNANQNIRVFGPEGYTAALMIVEAALYLDGVPGGGFDIDPFEANTAIAVAEHSAAIGAAGYADIPVVLTKSNPDAGLNYIKAVLIDPGGNTGPTSETLVLQLTG